MARTAKIVGISMMPNDKEALEIMAKKLEMTKSEVVRELVHQLSTDKVLAEIIKRKWTQERLDKMVAKDKRLSSHNVLYGNEMKIKASWKDKRPTTNGDQDHQDITKNLPYGIDETIKMARALFHENE